MKRKLLFAIFIIIAVFVLINIIWFVAIKVQYAPYERVVPLNEKFDVHHVDDNKKNVVYGYETPAYLHLTGNLYYTQKYPKKQIAYTFIIWPKLFKDEEYGVILQEEGESYQIEITPTLDVRGKDSNNQRSKELLKDHRADLEKVLTDARKTFQLND
ncbi:hypothetical protein [Rummeliibacillus sp. SL167]|uniref:hypothetical protein n=1 Tax=Rummeliibacillus sp. SL167 TaxID=2579792 RepID=UPI0011B64F6E|nr:hypothetical protein [Rummeliibacillus sp. SL167]